MPEGDVVFRTAERLRSALAGAVLVRADLRWPSLATSDLTGRQVAGVVSAGKHLLVRLGAGDRGGPLTLHSHLRMEGSWSVHRTGAPGRGVRGGHAVRAVLATQRWTAVGHRLGELDLVPTDREADLVGHLGPDVLGPAWDPATAAANLLTDPGRPVGEALLDQRVLAGVGTFFMCEALFVRGVTPWTPVGDAGDVGALVGLVHRMLSLATTSPIQTTTGDTRPGQRQWVHSRAGRACRRCGTIVRVEEIGQAPRARTASWCPTCQPGPAPARAVTPGPPTGIGPGPVGALRPRN